MMSDAWEWYILHGYFLFISLPPSHFPSLYFSLFRADIVKSAVAYALRSGLPLENREEELLPRGESIPRSLWWSKGDCRKGMKEVVAVRRVVDGWHRKSGWHWDRRWLFRQRNSVVCDGGRLWERNEVRARGGRLIYACIVRCRRR